jgi:hypothetical protein
LESGIPFGTTGWPSGSFRSAMMCAAVTEEKDFLEELGAGEEPGEALLQ